MTTSLSPNLGKTNKRDLGRVHSIKILLNFVFIRIWIILIIFCTTYRTELVHNLVRNAKRSFELFFFIFLQK